MKEQSSLRVRAALAGITLAGAVLRIALAYHSVRVGDEVGTLLNLRMSPAYLLTHFSGWLTMNYFILAEKGMAALFGSPGWPLEIIPLLSGVATIPLAAMLANRLGGPRLALVAAALVAFNPYLVQFSPVIRAYAPLAALAVASVLAFVRWGERRTWAAGTLTAAVIFLMLLAHPNGIYVVGGLAVLVAAQSLAGQLETRRLPTLALPVAAAGLATWLAYLGVAADVRVFSAQWGAPPPTSLNYLPFVFASYFGEGFPVFGPALLLLAGGWSATQSRRALLPLGVLVILSPVFISLKGVSHYPWAYARFQIYCVPLLLILMAEGVCWMAALVRNAGLSRALTAALTVLAILCWTPMIIALFATKKENAAYRDLAGYLLAHRQPGDLVVVEGQSQLEMTPFFPESDPPLRAVDFAAKPGRLPDGARLFYVATADHPLGASPERIGMLQAAEYSGPEDAIRASLHADLIRAAAHKVDAKLAAAYQVLSLLDKGTSPVPGEPSAREWKLLARLCQAQTRKFRYQAEAPAGEGKPGAPEGDN